MTRREFVYHPLKLERQLRTLLRARLALTTKCFSVFEFVVDDENQTFTYKKSYKIKGVRMYDDKTLDGRYEIETIDEENSKLIIILE